MRISIHQIYNSRNYSILLNATNYITKYVTSTTVEIILYYLTSRCDVTRIRIYNSRNYSILLNFSHRINPLFIYNSRNYSILLNIMGIYADSAIYNSRNYSILLNKCIFVVKYAHLQQ